jgi:DNA-binding CsgD family transcriptional regulator
LEADGELPERELDVLRLLSSELPTRQIAQNLYVATSTVRARVKSIYRKLGVSSRKEALEEARTRELQTFDINPLGEIWQWVKTDHPTVHYPAQNVGDQRPQRERRRRHLRRTRV